MRAPHPAHREGARLAILDAVARSSREQSRADGSALLLGYVRGYLGAAAEQGDDVLLAETCRGVLAGLAEALP